MLHIFMLSLKFYLKYSYDMVKHVMKIIFYYGIIQEICWILMFD